MKDFKRLYAPVEETTHEVRRDPPPAPPRKVRRLNPRLIWQQEGATAHWAAAEMKFLDELGFSKEDGTILIETLKDGWPAHSPDMNWLDQFVWGYMATELRYVSVKSKQGLIRAIKKIWKEKITPEFCKKSIDFFFKKGDRSCPWWAWGGNDPITGNKTKNPCTCGGHGTLDQIIKKHGDRVSFARTADGHGDSSDGGD